MTADDVDAEQMTHSNEPDCCEGKHYQPTTKVSARLHSYALNLALWTDDAKLDELATLLHLAASDVERLEPLAYRCEAHQDEIAGCPCCDAVRVSELEAERDRLRELCKRLALSLHNWNAGDLECCVDHDACVDWRAERD